MTKGDEDESLIHLLLYNENTNLRLSVIKKLEGLLDVLGRGADMGDALINEIHELTSDKNWRVRWAAMGMYPTIASRIVEHVRYEGRFKKVSDLYEAEDIIQGNDNIKAVIKRNEARLVT